MVQPVSSELNQELYFARKYNALNKKTYDAVMEKFGQLGEGDFFDLFVISRNHVTIVLQNEVWTYKDGSWAQEAES